MGHEIRQHIKDEMISASDFLAIYNDYILPEENQRRQEKGMSLLKPKRIDHYWENKATKEFIESLIIELKSKPRNSGFNSKSLVSLAKNYGLTKTKRGKEPGVFMNPYLFVDFAIWLSPAARVKVIVWITDSLILQRIEAGIKYRPMTEAVKKYLAPTYQPGYDGDNPYAHEAMLINKIVFGEHKQNIRQEANKEQLKLLEEIEMKNTVLIQAQVLELKRIEILQQSIKGE
jgi:hypothetical protein